MKKYSAVFFDFDGTLMDTSEGVFNGGRYAMEKLGLSIGEDADWKRFIGPPLHDCFRLAFGVQDGNVLRELCNAYRKYYRKEGMYQARFYDGILETIKVLRNNGLKTAITSMKNTDLIQAMCNHFGIAELFDGMFGLNAEETNTKADVIRQAMKAFSLTPGQCALVGDTYVDEQGAREAGCICIKVGWGFGFEMGQEGTIGTPREITGIVTGEREWI